jgi:hypothetical protein
MALNAPAAVVLPRVQSWAAAQWPEHVSFEGLPVCESVISATLSPDLEDAFGAHGGLTLSAECRYELLASVTGPYVCIDAVHESGHVFGQEHAPGGVMDADTPTYAPCAAWFDYTPENAPTRSIRALFFTGWRTGHCKVASGALYGAIAGDNEIHSVRLCWHGHHRVAVVFDDNGQPLQLDELPPVTKR